MRDRQADLHFMSMPIPQMALSPLWRPHGLNEATIRFALDIENSAPPPAT